MVSLDGHAGYGSHRLLPDFPMPYQPSVLSRQLSDGRMLSGRGECLGSSVQWLPIPGVSKVGGMRPGAGVLPGCLRRGRLLQQLRVRTICMSFQSVQRMYLQNGLRFGQLSVGGVYRRRMRVLD